MGKKPSSITLTVDSAEEVDGRWLAEVLELPGALAYGRTEAEAQANVAAVGFRILADLLEHRERLPGGITEPLPSIRFVSSTIAFPPEGSGPQPV